MHDPIMAYHILNSRKAEFLKNVEFEEFKRESKISRRGLYKKRRLTTSKDGKLWGIRRMMKAATVGLFHLDKEVLK